MATDKKHLNARVSKEEYDLLEAYAGQSGRSKTDVLREFLRSLKRKVKK